VRTPSPRPPATRRPKIDQRQPHAKAGEDYDGDCFLNFPFDAAYLPLQEALVFAVTALGLRPRCALENANGGWPRYNKIRGLIRDSRWGIHDLSRTELTDVSLPRFNMPFELGLFLGAASFGSVQQQEKSCLVLVRGRDLHQHYISDLAGCDPVPHQNDPDQMVRAVRHWVVTEQPAKETSLPNARELMRYFRQFQANAARVRRKAGLARSDETFTDLAVSVYAWIKGNPLQARPGRR